jgi:Universal stress protein family
MARGNSKLLINLCPNLIGARIGFRAPTLGSRPESPKIDMDQINKSEVKVCCNHELTNRKEEITRRKVMVAVDSSPEAKTALHWALSHAVQPDDILVLLDVVKPSSIGTYWFLYIFI